MTFQFKSTYVGELRTENLHLQSGTKIITDAPTDNMGKGEAFSPTDLLCIALTTCATTTMGIVAQREGIALEGMQCEIEKVMASNPRRIAEVIIKMHLPEAEKLEEKHRTLLKNTAQSCPVSRALSADVKQIFVFNF
jgi:putative redox protein